MLVCIVCRKRLTDAETRWRKKGDRFFCSKCKKMREVDEVHWKT